MARRRFVVHGASGSIPAPRGDRIRYGGNTTCFSLIGAGNAPIVIDAGTGLAFAPALRCDVPAHYHVLITHYHLDHLLGLQSFRPFFDGRHRFTFYGMPPEEGTIEQAIAGVFASPWFPLGLADIPCRRDYVELDGSPFVVDDVRVSSTALHHPQGVLGFRLETDGWSVVVATDHEADHGLRDAELVALSRNADVLVHDAQFTPEELAALYDGWGHSTWRDAARAANAAGVGKLVLTSHDPYRSDDGIDAIVALARTEFSDVVGAYEGLEL